MIRATARAAVLLLALPWLWPAPARAAAALPPPDASTVLLVVAPHPDDETLCCAGAMQQVRAAGGQVAVVWLTSGDGTWLGALLVEKDLLGNARRMRAYGERRMAEARSAAALLGVPPQGQLFLGYPDAGLKSLLEQERTRPYRSRFTDASAVPYAQALFPGHPYTGAQLEQDFAAVLERVQPTVLLAPTVLDSHGDHHAAGVLAQAAAQARPHLAVRYWIVHGGEGWPSPRGLVPGIPLTPAPLAASLPFVALVLTPAEEDQKLRALNAYATQMQVLKPFLLAFVRTTELFAPAR